MSTTEVLAASPQAPLTATPTPTGGGQDAAATNKTIATATEDHQPQQHQQQQQSNMSTTDVLAASPQAPPTAEATPNGGGQDSGVAIETTTTATKQKALLDFFDQPINSRNTAHRMNVSTSKSIMVLLEKEAVREGYVQEIQATYEAKERLYVEEQKRSAMASGEAKQMELSLKAQGDTISDLKGQLQDFATERKRLQADLDEERERYHELTAKRSTDFNSMTEMMKALATKDNDAIHLHVSTMQEKMTNLSNMLKDIERYKETIQGQRQRILELEIKLGERVEATRKAEEENQKQHARTQQLTKYPSSFMPHAPKFSGH
jgi:DNA repair exonuclease SbcCD ATPase subunit